MKIAKKKKEIEKEVVINENFLSEIVPKGGISFDNSRYFLTGTGYVACVYVYSYPKNVSLHWLSSLMNINNAVVILDVGIENINQAKKNINKSLEEQASRIQASATITESMDAKQKKEELEKMYKEVTTMGEVVKNISCRIFVPGMTLLDVDQAAKEVLSHLEGNGFRGAICLNEGRSQWEAIFLSYQEQQNSIYKKIGQPILSGTLAEGNPHHFSELSDPAGTYYGMSSAEGGGAVIWDMFRITNMRMSYNSVIVGKMGSGKSTTLKKMMLERAIRGDFIRAFDVANEFSILCKYLGGKIISLDGTGANKINALEILRTGETEMISYNHHLSKVTCIYRYLNPEADNYEVLMLEKLLRRLYVSHGIINEKSSTLNGITGRHSAEYPIFSDFLLYLRFEISKAKMLNSAEKNSKELSENEIIIAEKIALVIENIVDSYGNIFDGHTTIPNLYEEQIVLFDIQNLAGSKEEIFDAQLFIALALCWDNCVSKGSKMKKLYDNNEIAWNDITRFLVIIDESHRIINAKKLAGVEQVTLYEREARKYFGGIALASQSIRDFVPDGSSEKGINQIKTLFELTTYKLIMNQDNNCKEKLSQIFQNQFTSSELEKIPKLSKGQGLLSISGDQNIQVDIAITEEEKKLFTGGA
ncbi:MAG: VirB4 family type IV secretion system protein [Anaerovoracaceae bacterium]